MAIVKRLVEMMGGNIDVTSNPGEGTRVSVSLAFRPAEPERVEEDRKAALEAGMDFHLAKPIDVPEFKKVLGIIKSSAKGM